MSLNKICFHLQTFARGEWMDITLTRVTVGTLFDALLATPFSDRFVQLGLWLRTEVLVSGHINQPAKRFHHHL